MEINLLEKSFYEGKPALLESTREYFRLNQLKELGLEIVGIAQFGIPGLLSGIYIEEIWRSDDKDWDERIKWIKELKNRKK